MKCPNCGKLIRLVFHAGGSRFEHDDGSDYCAVASASPDEVDVWMEEG